MFTGAVALMPVVANRSLTMPSAAPSRHADQPDVAEVEEAAALDADDAVDLPAADEALDQPWRCQERRPRPNGSSNTQFALSACVTPARRPRRSAASSAGAQRVARRGVGLAEHVAALITEAVRQALGSPPSAASVAGVRAELPRRAPRRRPGCAEEVRGSPAPRWRGVPRRVEAGVRAGRPA